MNCATFRESVTDGLTIEANGAAAHLEDCSECRTYIEVLQEMDADLTRQFAGISVAPDFDEIVISRVRAEALIARPSLIPELLDSIGWIGSAAVLVTLGWVLTPAASITALVNFESSVLASLAVMAMIAAVWTTYRYAVEPEG